jgi:hypothetical protein
MRDKTGGNTGIGNTGRPQGPLGPAPMPQPTSGEDLMSGFKQF